MGASDLGDKPSSKSSRTLVKGRRRRRNRSETEADLRAAALKLLATRGPLAGLNLQEVADEADVNRVQIYQYYGTRQALLCAAIMEMLSARAEERQPLRDLPFADRRRAMFDHFLRQPELVKLEALLALDNQDELTVFVEIDKARRNLERDMQRGDLPADADGLVMHVMTAATYMGYCIFREVYARDTGIPLSELDKRAGAVYALMLEGLTGNFATAPQENNPR